MRRRLALLVVASLVSVGCSAQSPVTQPATGPLLVADACADLVVLGARGSGQSTTKNLGVGLEVRRTVEALATRVHERSPGTTVRLEAVPYDSAPAVSLDAYQDQVVAGVAMLDDLRSSLVDRCPDSRIALVGFSEGAQVVHGAAIDMPAADARRVALVAMIADPRRNPSDGIEQFTYGAPAPGAGWLGAGTPVDSDLRDVAITLCAGADLVCRYDGAADHVVTDTHRHFYEQPAHVAEAAAQLDHLLQQQR